MQKYYRHTSRELKRISSVTLSPIYAHFLETVTGIVTIRALRQHQRYATDRVSCTVNQKMKCKSWICKCMFVSQGVSSFSVFLSFDVLFLLKFQTYHPDSMPAVWFKLTLTEMDQPWLSGKGDRLAPSESGSNSSWYPYESLVAVVASGQTTLVCQ